MTVLTFKIIYCLISLKFWQSISLELCKIMSFTGDIHPRIRHQKIITSYNKKINFSFQFCFNLKQFASKTYCIWWHQVGSCWGCTPNPPGIKGTASPRAAVLHSSSLRSDTTSRDDGEFFPYSLSHTADAYFPETQNFKHIFLKNKIAVIIIDGY